MSKKKKGSPEEDKKFPLPVYGKEDDIYNREKEEPFEEDNITGKKRVDKNNDGPADDLDIPGTELDDSDEAIGEEDE